ncbi:MAG: bifunctional transcriptional activator/DNA repair protein Ada [Spirochaetaceae bacterium]|nr:bifunctional transcriptional activator/DNA repair protein Ada [Spirochaetaceae bacterium]
MPELPPFEEMDRAFRGRDAAYDGVFYAAVSTTGIFCRPSCPARKPLPENLRFYATAAEALFAGFRPCKRCAPLQAAADPPWVATLVARVEADPRLRIRDADLRAEGLDPAAVRRRFQARFGLSFQAYQRARRLAAAFEAIKVGGSIDDAVFDAGYDSHSGFREAFSRLFGAPPGAAAAGSAGLADFIRLAWIDTPLGPLVAAATDRGVCLLEFSDRRMLEAQARILSARIGLPALPGAHPHLERLRAELAGYFAGERSSFGVPVFAPGTPFQERVWAALRQIPPGETRSYAELARAVGDPAAVRAVARANGMNRVAILVPCHRVIGSDGGLGGYGGGLWRKRRLLEIEGAPHFE